MTPNNTAEKTREGRARMYRAIGDVCLPFIREAAHIVPPPGSHRSRVTEDIIRISIREMTALSKTVTRSVVKFAGVLGEDTARGGSHFLLVSLANDRLTAEQSSIPAQLMNACLLEMRRARSVSASCLATFRLATILKMIVA